MPVFQKDNETVSETNISSKPWEEEGIFFFFYYVFSLWLLRERVECISGMYLLNFQWDNRNLAEQQEISLPCLRVSHSLIPNLPGPSAKAQSLNVPRRNKYTKQGILKDSFDKTRNTHTARTFIQQNTEKTRKHPAWLLAWLPLPFDELSWQVGDCPDLNIINQQGRMCFSSKGTQAQLTGRSLPLKLHCYWISKSPNRQSHMENTWPQQLPHNRSSWLLHWAKTDLEKAILKNKNSDIPSSLPALRVKGSRGFGADG